MENHGLPKVTEVTDEFESLCFVFRQSRPVQECESRVRILKLRVGNTPEPHNPEFCLL